MLQIVLGYVLNEDSGLVVKHHRNDVAVEIIAIVFKMVFILSPDSEAVGFLLEGFEGIVAGLEAAVAHL